jgi:hypothetical protein
LCNTPQHIHAHAISNAFEREHGESIYAAQTVGDREMKQDRNILNSMLRYVREGHQLLNLVRVQPKITLFSY